MKHQCGLTTLVVLISTIILLDREFKESNDKIYKIYIKKYIKKNYTSLIFFSFLQLIVKMSRI